MASATGAAPDPRLGQAVEWLRSTRLPDDRRPPQGRFRGRDWFELEPVGQPTRWITRYALRILRWWDDGLPSHPR